MSTTWFDTPGSTLLSRFDAVDFAVSTEPAFVSVGYRSRRPEELAFRDGAFVYPFLNSTREGNTFALRRTGGWPSTPSVSVEEAGAVAVVSMPYTKYVSQTTQSHASTLRTGMTLAVMMKIDAAHTAGAGRNLWCTEAANTMGRGFRIEADRSVRARSVYSPNLGGGAELSRDLGIVPLDTMFFAVAVYSLSSNYETLTAYVNGALIGTNTTPTPIDINIGIGTVAKIVDNNLSNVRVYAVAFNRDVMTGPDVAQWWTDIKQAGRYVQARTRIAAGADVWLGTAPLTYCTPGSPSFFSGAFSTVGFTNGIDTAAIS